MSLTPKFLAERAGRLLPRQVLLSLKRFYVFRFLYGQTSSREGFITNGQGDYWPWFTYPAIEFLETLDLSRCSVFEFGAGSSTLYWAKRVARVVSVEKDRQWYGKLTKQLPANAECIHAPTDEQYVAVLQSRQDRFDVVVVDGAARAQSAKAALEGVAPDGLIILDNAEWYPHTAKYLRAHGWTGIEFSGFAPVNAYPHATTIFFRERRWLDAKKAMGEWKPLGGKLLIGGAYDDSI